MNLDPTTKIAHSVFLLGQDDQLWVWGVQVNTSLLLHTEDKIHYKPTPVPASNLPCTTQDIKQICFGKEHSLLLTKDGIVYGWGSNSRGQLGFPQKKIQKVVSPTLVDIQKKIKSLHCGSLTSYILTKKGHVYCFGDKRQVVHPRKSPNHVPTRIRGLENITKISSSGHGPGHEHVLALTKEGKVYGWGFNNMSQLGVPYNGSCTSSLLQVPLEEDISEICAGIVHSIFLTNSGKLYACGANYWGQLGVCDRTHRIQPTLVCLEGVVSYVSGWKHSLALTQDGSLFSWGNNEYLQLGHDIKSLPKKIVDNIPKPSLVDLKIPESVVWIGAGECESMILTENGNLYTWGKTILSGHRTEEEVTCFSEPSLVPGIKFKLPPKVFEKKWKKIFIWMFLGKSDPNSDFSCLPVEVIFHSLTVA
jgi:alpha-tubulin suppressor-like RCC1 family protein